MMPVPIYVENVPKNSYPAFEAVLATQKSVPSQYDEIISPSNALLLLDQVRRQSRQECFGEDVIIPSVETIYQTELTIRTLPSSLLTAVDRSEALLNPHGTFSLVFEKGDQWGEIEIGRKGVSVIAFRGRICVLKSTVWNYSIAVLFMKAVLTGDGTIHTT